MSDHIWDPTRDPIRLGSFSLTRCFRENPRLATVNEYASAANMEVDRVVNLLGTSLDAGHLALEIVEGQLFVQTAPSGRPPVVGMPDCPPNMWELLRRRSNERLSWALWKLCRSLERSGWGVTVDDEDVAAACPGVNEAPLLGVTVGATLVGGLVFPATHHLRSGLLDRYENAGLGSVAVICDQGHLESVVAGCRAWMLSGPHRQLRVLVLESPRYQPVLVDPADGSTQPVSIVA
ncbi:MAG: hypothetical protein GY882_01705 [Actinomycetia bacterium]|nr:hypothetical protein [Actinomycetes bacterium]MCP4844886.1 hypothetical protein [Actinomycetes bacterium]